jgi:hypothetical protein
MVAKTGRLNILNNLVTGHSSYICKTAHEKFITLHQAHTCKIIIMCMDSKAPLLETM